jgi:hypothetical protein
VVDFLNQSAASDPVLPSRYRFLTIRNLTRRGSPLSNPFSYDSDYRNSNNQTKALARGHDKQIISRTGPMLFRPRNQSGVYCRSAAFRCYRCNLSLANCGCCECAQRICVAHAGLNLINAEIVKFFSLHLRAPLHIENNRKMML